MTASAGRTGVPGPGSRGQLPAVVIVGTSTAVVTATIKAARTSFMTFFSAGAARPPRSARAAISAPRTP
ncbi:hypothetical protein [Streptomyces sp. 8N616]|uniref:hypothetical protein n=1 Tax=Streptomyces sp. 8N616 TaxID=3457414 RepID=UPI003FD0E489